MEIWGLLWLIALIFLLGAFPLYILVKLMGGRVSLIKALIIKVAAVIITLLLSIAFGVIGPIITAIFLIIFYALAFRMGLIRSFIAWLLEGVVLAAVIFTLGALGIAAIKWNGIIAAFKALSAYL
ncbi:hypothetical protein KY363_04905 [Candidatus Woesearchaeota archaeon]|nr:hypothetical protein [Candidatus Woesearchaeota archaeon]